MARVATVIGSALAFALLGLAAGHLCVETIKGRSPDRLNDEFVMICYMAAPAAGAAIGFIASFVALKWAGPRESFHPPRV